MSIIEDRLPYLESLRLGRGSHAAPDNGMTRACVMEAVAYIAAEPWSDHPECASPVIAMFLRAWNDQLNGDDRQMLKPYVPRLVGTATTEADELTRAWLATDWLARECAPAFLRLAGLTAQAELLEGLAPLVSPDTARSAQPSLDAARDAAWAAAWAALAPTVKTLQASALLLLERMIEVGRV